MTHKMMPTVDNANNVALRYPVDYQDHTGTRLENDRRLLPIADDIKSGHSIENLERFAKAYLGMYLDMDNSIPANDRISILANPELARFIYAGFESVLNNTKFPSAETIADSLDAKDLPEGYILLAAMDLYGDRDQYSLSKLPAATLIATLCFQYAYKNEIDNHWLHDLFLQRPNEAIDAFNGFWQQLITHNIDHLPGIYQIIGNRQHDHISKQVLLPVLTSWLSVRRKLLRDILRGALRSVDSEQLHDLANKSLSRWNAAEPARYILWLACAFLLQPDKHRLMLFEYTRRSKEKLVPLLDFVYWVLHTDQLTLPLGAHAYADLISIIAAKITPQKDRYGEFCHNTRKVLFLFFCLAKSKDNSHAIMQLSNIRVMKLYAPILEWITNCNVSTDTRPIASQLDDFIKQLIKHNLIHPRKKWSD